MKLMINLCLKGNNRKRLKEGNECSYYMWYFLIILFIYREQELMDTIGITEGMSDEEKDEKYNNYMQEQYRQMEEVMGIEVN